MRGEIYRMKMDETLWYHNFGFMQNPFSIKPGIFQDELVGSEKTIEEVKDVIGKGSICFITGTYGYGKTTLFKNVIDEYSGKKQVIYYSCNRKERTLNFDKLLIGRSWYNRLFVIKPKGMVLLLDEVQSLNKKEQAKLIEYYEEGYFRSIVIAAIDENNVRISKDLKELIADKVFRLTGISADEAVTMIRMRIGSLDFLNDEMIKEIYSMNPNPRACLENCEDVCRYAFERGSAKVEAEHLKIVKNISMEEAEENLASTAIFL